MPSTECGVLEFLKNMSGFSLELIKKAYFEAGGREQNIVLPTFAINVNISLLYWGAKNRCAREMEEVLKLNVKDPRMLAAHYEYLLTELNSITNSYLKTAVKLYLKDIYDYDNDFRRTANTHFNTGTKLVDGINNSRSIKRINDSIKESTGGAVRAAVTEYMFRNDPNPDFAAVIGCSFKKLIGAGFENLHMPKDRFYKSPILHCDVNMVAFSGYFNCASLDDLRAQVIEIPLSEKDISMLIFLPFYRFGLESLQATITNDDLFNMPKIMIYQKKNVRIPVFRIASRTNLENLLEKVGIQIIFSSYADLSYMLHVPARVKLSHILHKTIFDIKVDTTSIPKTNAEETPSDCLDSGDAQDFIADHPFLFVIRWNKFNIPLLMGTVRSPPT